MPSKGPHGHNTLVNGVDVAAIRMLIEAAETAPEMARARYRVGTTWKPSPEGSWEQIHSYGLKDCDTEDEGDPTPEEQLLGVVNSCLILGLRVRCALEGLHLDLIEVTTTADSDLRGLVGLPTATPGLRAIDTQVGFGGQDPAERLQVVAQEVLSASSILACLRRPLEVSTRVAV